MHSAIGHCYFSTFWKYQIETEALSLQILAHELIIFFPTRIDCVAKIPSPFAWSILYNNPVLSRCIWSTGLITWKNCIHPDLVLLQFAVKPAIAYFLSVCVLIPSSGLLLPWPDLLWCLSRVLIRLWRKAGGVTGGLDDNYPSTPFHLTMVQVSTTDLISDVHGCNRTQQKGRSIGFTINRSEWGFTERSAQIDSHIITLQPLSCCMLVIKY